MIKKFIIFVFVVIVVVIFSSMSPPYATDNPNKIYDENTDIYEVYQSDIWEETHNSVNKSESHFLDLGTRTLDGSMHIYLKSQAPASNYELHVESVELKENKSKKGIYIKSTVKQTENIGSQIITDVNTHIQMKQHTQTDIDYVQAEITDGWNETRILQRDACGCVLTEDPIPE